MVVVVLSYVVFDDLYYVGVVYLIFWYDFELLRVEFFVFVVVEVCKIWEVWVVNYCVVVMVVFVVDEFVWCEVGGDVVVVY